MDETRREFLEAKVVPYVTAMTRLLHLLGRDSASWRARPEPRGNIAECLLDRPDFSVRIVCRPGGIRPFLGFMDRPWPHKAFLGRLNRDGSVHVSDYGLKVFFNFLWEEGVLDSFTLDVEAAVRRFAEAAARDDGEARARLPENEVRPPDRETRNQ